jgi:hypothetical protein
MSRRSARCSSPSSTSSERSPSSALKIAFDSPARSTLGSPVTISFIAAGEEWMTIGGIRGSASVKGSP